MTWGGVAIGVGTLGSAALGYFGNKGSSDASQVPLETAEQGEARRGLLEFGKTGSYGNYTAGTPYSGSLGDFGLSALERGGLDRITANASAGPGEQFTMGSDVLRDLLTTDKYNPLNNEGVYAGLSGKIDRTTRDASDALKRNAGFGGSLYSSSTIRSLGDVASRGAETKAATLASLYDNYVGRKLGGVNTAFGAQEQLDQKGQQQLSNEFTFGALPRNLKTAEDQANYAEFQRQRQEKQGQISAVSSVAGSNTNFGVPNVSIPKDDPWTDVLGLLAQFGGQYLGSKQGQRTAPKAA